MTYQHGIRSSCSLFQREAYCNYFYGKLECKVFCLAHVSTKEAEVVSSLIRLSGVVHQKTIGSPDFYRAACHADTV